MTPPAPEEPGPVYATSDEAVAELQRRMGPASQIWTYHDDYEDPARLILRWDKPAPADGGKPGPANGGKPGKEIRPVSRTREGWVLGGMPTPAASVSACRAAQATRGISS